MLLQIDGPCMWRRLASQSQGLKSLCFWEFGARGTLGVGCSERGLELQGATAPMIATGLCGHRLDMFFGPIGGRSRQRLASPLPNLQNDTTRKINLVLSANIAGQGLPRPETCSKSSNEADLSERCCNSAMETLFEVLLLSFWIRSSPQR